MDKFNQAWSGSAFTRKAAGTGTENASMADRDAAITALLQSGAGLKRVAFAMSAPLKSRLDYVAIGRKLLLVDELPVGEIPAYDLDIPEFGAVRIGARGSAPIHEANIKRIEIPTWVLSEDHVIKWEELAIRRYPAFDRAKERVAIAMAIGEDDEVFKVLATAASLAPNTGADLITSGHPVSKAAFADLFGVIAGRQLVPSAYVLAAKRYADIQKWNSTDLDQVSLNVLLETGQYGVLFGTRLIVSTRIDPAVIYCTTTPDKLGRIPERKAVEVKIFDNVRELQYDIVGFEQIGIGVYNIAGVAKCTVS